MYDPQKGDPYPEVVYEDVMSKDTAVLEWLDNIVSLPQRFTHSDPLGNVSGLLSNSGHGAFAS